MTKAVSHQPRTHDAVKPSLRNPSVRLGGSNVGIRPFPTGALAPPDSPTVSVPDVALQFFPCLEAIPVDPGIDLLTEVIAAVQTAIPGSGDVLYKCAGGSGRIGIWMSAKGSGQVEAARSAGLDAIDLLGETKDDFAIWINASFIRSRAAGAWDAQPKRTDEDGTPDPSGPVHLTGMSVNFVSPNSIVTDISGYDETPWPDVSFDLLIGDTFSVSASQVQVQSGTSIDVDESYIDLLLGISAMLATFISPAFYAAVLAFVVEGAIVVSTEPGNFGGGAGAAAARNIPTEMFLPQGQKIVFRYTDVAVDSGGLTAFATALLMPRMPSVTVIGARQLSVEPGTSQVTRTFQAQAYDLRSPVVLSWEGGASLTPTVGSYSSVTFDYAGLAPGGSTTRELRVSATDVDGLSTQTTVLVEIFMTKSGNDIPPLCKVKPWLPQCK